jgi:hypothetical protein
VRTSEEHTLTLLDNKRREGAPVLLGAQKKYTHRKSNYTTEKRGKMFIKTSSNPLERKIPLIM